MKEKQQNFDSETNLKIAKQILEALIFFRKNKLVHSGLKPSNILLDNQLNVKISDFGIARLARI